ncbi:sigma-70 family RNA polymerase sigma factor [Acidicapsa dinghuensis]|uniref:Sigma-70 family RNA polymerase sigma factor n=1 Tax=Acidicapsa dinghuensis TaxID=2218256 RepID=A0ABW1ECE1_9BACT|nr:sigma-70 family RNA polymerase sigma factor [Acidicapsa dinghuensis]
MEREQFEQLTMPLFDQLYNFAHWLSQNRADAEDLVQETYAKALKGWKSFEEGTNLRAWMYRILRNTFLTSKSGLKALATMQLDEEEVGATGVLTHGSTPELLLLQQESHDAMLEALAGLPVIYREVVLLCEAEEMSYREIAQVVAIPVGTVMSRLARGRRMLREALTARVSSGATEARHDAV